MDAMVVYALQVGIGRYVGGSGLSHFLAHGVEHICG